MHSVALDGEPQNIVAQEARYGDQHRGSLRVFLERRQRTVPDVLNDRNLSLNCIPQERQTIGAVQVNQVGLQLVQQISYGNEVLDRGIEKAVAEG